MKKRLHDKKAGIAILAALIIISLAEIISRAFIMKEVVLNTSNLGEPMMTMLFAIVIMAMTFKGKDRICYICYGAWLSYFVLDQLFEIPGTILTWITVMETANWVLDFGKISFLLRIFSMFGVVGIGVLLVEYMNDKTIYNRAFNGLCVTTILLIAVNIISSVHTAIIGFHTLDVLVRAINNLSRMIMVFLFTFFAYDSAMAQFAKTTLTK
jgi:hypothetical protein